MSNENGNSFDILSVAENSRTQSENETQDAEIKNNLYTSDLIQNENPPKEFEYLNEHENIIENVNFARTKQSNYANLTFFEKIKLWTKINLDYIITACTLFVAFLVVLIVNGDMPFGNKSFLVSDTYEQVAVFFNHFFDMFEGKATLFYTNYFAKGIEIFSTLEYMYLNPFYLIVFFGGRQNIYVMMTFSLIFMLIFNGLIFVWFSRKYFKKVNTFTRIIFALLYSLSGYINFGIPFSTWIIYPALILIVTDRFLNFMKTRKMTSFICSLVWYVVACYSVGISTTIVLVVLMVSYILYFEEKEKRAKSLTDLFVVLAVSALASLIILFPSIMGVLATDRSSSFIKNLIGTEDTNILVKIAVIFFDSIIIILNIFYLIKCNKKDKINKFLLFIAIIVYIPIIFDSVMKMLCFSTYQCFSSRFYFMNEALIFSIALLVFEKELFVFKDGKTTVISKVLLLSFSAIFLILFAFIELLNFRNIGVNLKSALYNESGLTKIFATIFFIVLFILVVGYILNIRKILSSNAMKKLVMFFMAFSLLFNYISFIGNAGDIRDKSIEQLISSSNVSGNLKLFQNSFDYNNYNIRHSELRCSSVFTSLISSETQNSYSYLGYNHGKTHVNTKGGNLISDSLLGLNYYLIDHEENRPYLELISANSKYYLYKNKLATNGTFILNSEFNFDETASVYENYEKLKEFFGISGTLFEDANITKCVIDDEDASDDFVMIKVEYTASENGVLYLDRIFSKDSNSNLGSEIYIATENAIYTDLKYLESGETFTFKIKLQKNRTGDEFEKLHCYFLNYNVAERLIEKLKEKQTSFAFTKDGYQVETQINSDESLYIMVPDIEGLHYEINGNEIEVNKFFGGMVKLNSSEQNIKLVVTYRYPHLIKWIIFAIIAVVLMSFIILTYHFTKFRHLQKIIEFLMKSMVIVILVVVYAVGILLSFVWFFA